jgi:hypothetical protein
MKTWLYHPSTPPTYSYHKATSAYTAAIQLYARSGQLPTRDNMKRKSRIESDESILCRLGCEEIETVQHVFVECDAYKIWREEAGHALKTVVEERLKNQDMGDEQITYILSKAKSFFQNGKDLWPLGDSQYYLGYVPNLRPLLPRMENENRIARERMVHGIYCDWHNASIRLASRIFGDFQRRVAKHWDERNGKDRKE